MQTRTSFTRLSLMLTHAPKQMQRVPPYHSHCVEELYVHRPLAKGIEKKDTHSVHSGQLLILLLLLSQQELILLTLHIYTKQLQSHNTYHLMKMVYYYLHYYYYSNSTIYTNTTMYLTIGSMSIDRAEGSRTQPPVREGVQCSCSGRWEGDGA
jgi:hypothetical protein